MKLKEYDDGTVQTGMAWLKKRALNRRADGSPVMVLGGSELAAALFKKLDSFMNEAELLERKGQFLATGVPEVMDTVHVTEWGHVMEPALRYYGGRYFHTDCWELNASVVHPAVENFRYSPDGFTLLEVDGELCFVLLEHKNPWRRTVKPDTMIPPKYVPQVMAGLDTFRWCQYALFTEANFCAVDLGGWGQNRFNPGIHIYGGPNGKKPRDKRFEGLQLVDSCLIAFYEVDVLTDEQRLLLQDVRMKIISNGRGWSDKYDTIDLGAMDNTWFEAIMNMHHMKTLKSSHSRFMNMDDVDLDGAVADMSKEKKPWAFMVVNMFAFAWYVKEPEKYYVEMHSLGIKKFCEKLERVVEEKGGLHAMFSE